MALTLAARLAGQQVAERLQLDIEYDPNPLFEVGYLEKADPVMVEKLCAKVGLLRVFNILFSTLATSCETRSSLVQV